MTLQPINAPNLGTNTRRIAMAVAACAGLAATAVGQETSHNAYEQHKAVLDLVDLRQLSELIDMDVDGLAEEDIGEVENAIIHRDSGVIVALVIEPEDGFLLGGDPVIVRTPALQWPKRGDALRVASNNLARFVEFDEDRWDDAGDVYDTDDDDELEDALDDVDWDWLTEVGIEQWQDDGYEGDFEDALPFTFTGEIKRITRERMGNGTTRFTLQLTDPEAARKVIDLGPSWYVNSVIPNLATGDTVTVHGIRPGHEFDRMFVELITRGDNIDEGSAVRLRTVEGRPLWLNDTRYENSPHAAPLHAVGQYVLAKDLLGNNIDFQGDDTGEVDELLVDRRSGRIAFISVDPDQGVFGYGDTETLVPWQLAYVTPAGEIALDEMTEEQAAAAPEAPDNRDEYRALGFGEHVYQHFNAAIPDFTPRFLESITPDRAIDGVWGDGEMLARMVRGKDFESISGTIEDTTTVTPVLGAYPGYAIEVRDSGSTYTVILGPNYYVQDLPTEFLIGNRVRLEAAPVNIAGAEQSWVARSVTTQGSTIQFWDRNGRPVWTREGVETTQR